MNNRKICLQCGKIFGRPYGQGLKTWEKRRFCSYGCYWFHPKSVETIKKQSDAKKGKPPWNKDSDMTETQKKILSLSLKKWHKDVNSKLKRGYNGDQNHYKNLHWHIRQKFGKPTHCEHCGITAEIKRICWANRTGKYLLEKTDWLMLCYKCHWKYDKVIENITENGAG